MDESQHAGVYLCPAHTSCKPGMEASVLVAFSFRLTYRDLRLIVLSSMFRVM
jgi:hypothetical protein